MEKRTKIIQQVISWLVLLILGAYTFAYLILFPFVGFYYVNATGSIEYIFVPSSEEALQIGDLIRSVDGAEWETYVTDLRQTLFAGVQAGQPIEIVVERSGDVIATEWTSPGWNAVEMISRLSNIYWLAYLFWIAGFLTVLLIRPLDLRQWLLMIFFYLTALWLMWGATGTMRIWDATILFRMAIWVCVPVYLHFHWIFPQPFREIRTVYWLPLYLLAVVLAVGEWLQLLPVDAYFYGVFTFLIGSILLLLLHFVFQRERRRDIGIMALIVLVSLLPVIILAGFVLAQEVTAASFLSLLALTGLPLGYFYTAYRRQPGWPQVRANLVVTFYLFVVLLSILGIAFSGWLARGGSGRIGVLSAALTILILVAFAIQLYPRFRRLVERHLLGVRIDPRQIIATYATLIPTSLSLESLGHLLERELMPSMLVRQSALLRYENRQKLQPVYMAEVDPGQLPDPANIREIIQQSTDPQLKPNAGRAAWTRLIVPLVLQDEFLGVWLFGRRDPDDVYSAADVYTLKILGDQTAVALANINQAERLRLLYDNNIQRHEEERKHLARVLHDEVLNEMTVINLTDSQSMDRERVAGRQELSERIRNIISGLRPAMIEYGLWHALVEFVDDLEERENVPLIELTIPKSDARYPEEVEGHLFRIIQQAAENALEHAGAHKITIGGALGATEALIVVQDDGQGLGIGSANLDFNHLLRAGHYGLVGMMERATLIGGELMLSSSPDEGTQVQVHLKRRESERD